MAEKDKTVFALSDIVLDEVSLVDNPANQSARVVLFKRDADEISNANTRKAANTTKEGHDMTLQELQVAVEKMQPQIDELKTSRDAEKRRADTAETALTKLREQHTQAPDDKRTDVEKLIAKLDGDTAKSVQKLQEDNEALLKRQVEMERVHLLTKSAAEIGAKYPNLPMDSRKAAQVLEKLDKDEAETMAEMFASSNAAFGEILREHGTVAVSDGSDTLAKLMKAARDIQKAEKLTFVEAIERAEQENPELVREQQSEQ